MPDMYTIYLINQSADRQLFRCFLAPYVQAVSDPKIYASSNVSLSVASNSPASNFFAIPAQYKVGAGASNARVGTNVEIEPSIFNDAALGDTWEVSYANWPPNEAPTMTKSQDRAAADAIAIVTNHFDKSKNGNNGWFSSQSFGIQAVRIDRAPVAKALARQSLGGFIGITWDPEPGLTRTLTPQLVFYVAISEPGNGLASWKDIVGDAAVIHAPADFLYNECTVTYSATGTWSFTPGEPTG
jgi:hypothetical protein